MNADFQQQWCHEPGSAKQLADKLAALSHPARLRILRHLSGRGACCCKEVVEQLDRRQATDAQHAHDIYAAFRANLRDSLDALKRAEAEAAAQLLPDDQQRQRRRDIDGMQRRLDELDDEEAREVAAVTDRYADVKPHTTAAAVVFALTTADAEAWTR